MRCRNEAWEWGMEWGMGMRHGNVAWEWGMGMGHGNGAGNEVLG